MNIIVTFVAIIMKYTYCILISLFLILGFTQISYKNIAEFQSEVGTPSLNSMQFVDGCCISSAVDGQCCSSTRSLFNDETTEHKIGDVIFSGITNVRNVTPTKLLKLKINTAIYQLLSLLDSSRWTENDYRQLSFNTNSIRYSYGYYIYSLAHILI